MTFIVYNLLMDISILGVPLDLGAGQRGMDMGPAALRNTHLLDTLRALGHTVNDLGDIAVPQPPQSKHAQFGYDYLQEVRQTCASIYERLTALPENQFILTLGGDHSLSMGSVPGAARGQRSGLLWIDAHADFNTPQSSPSGNIHGMPVAHLAGLGEEQLRQLGGGWQVRPEDIVFIGLRSVDSGERELLKEAGITAYTMKDVDLKGIPYICEAALEQLQHTERLHVSFDADALDPSVCPGLGTPVPGGLSYREGRLLMELLSDSGRARSLDVVEVNPARDRENQTAQVMADMAAALLGQTLL